MGKTAYIQLGCIPELSLEALAVRKFSLLSRGWQLKLVGSVAIVGTLPVGVSDRVNAQILPDNTLGAESSVVTPDVIKGIQGDRIDGGATRGANLFHSFWEFNVGEGRGAYFANPTGIENILTRVTGNNASNILGRLGVLGGANLFLLNPNGIVFGSNASLDIQGSFVATTAERIQLGDSGYFSAAEPQTSSLLSVSPEALFFSQVANQPGSIINQGNLATGKNLTLSAGNLDLQGQLLSGGDLTLQAQDTVKVRDSVTTPFLAQSGGNLTIIGNGGIDILALNHPTQTPFVSGGNLSLISDGVISGDARFSSGGSFSIQTVSGGLANFVSYYDPIISASGDVDVAANYTGTSLLVEATGNIRFQGDINITGPDTSILPDGSDTATLSTTSALIMRSGQSNLAYGGFNSGDVPAYSTGAVPAGITIGGNVTLQPFNGSGGMVSLLAASGNVSTQGMTTNGGAIHLSAIGGSISTSDLRSYSSSNDGNAGAGGAIHLEAIGGSINTGYLNSNSYSNYGNAGAGGAIHLEAIDGSINTGYLLSDSYSEYGNAGVGGTIHLSATDGNIFTDYLKSGSSSTYGTTGSGGAIHLEAIGGSINTGYLYSDSSSYGNAGSGGTIHIAATDGSISIGYLKSGSSSYSGNAGAGGAIHIAATDGSINTDYLNSNSYSNSGNAGVGGAIHLSATGGSISTGYLLSDSYSEYGNAGVGGTIHIAATDGNIFTDYLKSGSSSDGNAGAGGAIYLEATGGSINTGDLFSNSSSNSGNAGVGGAIHIAATGGSINTGDLASNSQSSDGNVGVGGTIHLEAIHGSIETGYLKSTSSSNYGNAREGGAIHLEATGGSITTAYLDSASFSNYGTTGSGGAIHLEATDGSINTGDLFSASSSDDDAGAGGAIHLESTNGSIEIGVLRSYSSSNSGNAGVGGAIHLSAISGDITTHELISNSYSNSGNAGSGGAIHIAATGGSIETGVLFSNSYSANSGNAGVGGAIHLEATGGSINTGDLFSFSYSNSDNTGEGGNISLEATNTIQLLRYQYDPNTNTFNRVPGSGSINSTGKLGSGNITIASYAPFVYDNEIITSDTFGSGKGGDILISVPAVTLSGGAQLSASTHSSGQGGNITVRASEKVELTGATTEAPEGIFASQSGFSAIPPGTYLGGYIPNGDVNSFPLDNGIRIPPPGTRFPSGVFTQTTVGSTGNAGNIRIETGQLNINNGAAIATTTFGQGNAGNIWAQPHDSISIANGGSILSGVAGGAIGNSGKIELQTRSLSITGGVVQTQTLGEGKAGDIQVRATDDVILSGADSGLRSGSGGSNILLGTIGSNIGQGGDITITTDRLSVADEAVVDAQTLTNSKGGDITVNANTLSAINGGQLLTSTSGGGQAGDITLNASELNLTGSNSGLFAQTSSTANAGNLTLQPLGNGQTVRVNLQDGAQISASTSGNGQGGNLSVKAPQAVTISGNGKLSVETSGAGAGGNLNIDTQQLTIADGATVSASTSSTNPNGIGGNLIVTATQSLGLSNGASLRAQSTGAAPAGNITINTGNLTARDVNIATSSEQSSGGGITITADRIRLFGDSDITTNVNQGAGGGGNIYLKAGSILAFDDSDILAFARDGRGGNITLDTPAFFGENYRPAPRNTNPDTLDNNNQVDVNASGAVNGVITTPDVSFIQNSLTELPSNQIDTDSLLANSCIVRRNQPTRGSFTITGTGGFPQRPGDAQMSSFPTVDIETLPSDSTPTNTNQNRPWQKGDPIVEPQGVYRLPDGKLVMSRECSHIQ